MKCEELKAFKVVSAYIEYEDGTHDSGFDFEAYDKSEADKVIAHQKRKRCLAMVKWCHNRWADIATPYFKSVWYRKWQLRWLELAEKFKEAK